MLQFLEAMINFCIAVLHMQHDKRYELPSKPKSLVDLYLRRQQIQIEHFELFCPRSNLQWIVFTAKAASRQD